MSREIARDEEGGRGTDDGAREPGPRAETAGLMALAGVSTSQPLSPIAGNVLPEIRDFAETLRVLFGALDMSLNRLAALLHSDPGTVSRYLSGKRVPPPDFIDSLCKAVYDVKGSLVTPQVQEFVHEQFLVALRAHNPARYEVQRLTDLLQAAAQEKRQYEITVAALEEAIAGRNDTIYALELEGRQLRAAWARAEGLLEEEREHRERLQQTIDSLNTEVSYFKKQLLSAQQRATVAEEKCQELEGRLDSAGALLPDEYQREAPFHTAALSGGQTRPNAPASTGDDQQGRQERAGAGTLLSSDGPFLRIEDSGAVMPLRDGVTTIGRGHGVDVSLEDPSVERLHAEIVRRGPHIYVSDLGLSQNGTRVNGRPIARRLLQNGDVLTFGAARAKIGGFRGEDTDAKAVLHRELVPELTRRELDLLASLCRPAMSSEAFALPATAHEIAMDLVVTEAAVKQHLLRLYQKFRVSEGPERRTRLANKVVEMGLVRPASGAQ
jgi:transcriptional regulator with XRE-family HTH domain